ncbi:MAG: hypothetical protein K2M78_12965 [Lachnospiraceae bacterium]|nr:hypothetical protein [Lachnospiraceae bacterium]
MFREELGKMMSNVSFYAAIAAVVLLMMTSNVFKSFNTGREYNLFDIIFSEEREELVKESGYSAVELIATMDNSYLIMFLPIAAAVPFVMIVCGEKKNSITRFEIYRTGKNRYVMGKFLAATVVGGVIAVVGTCVYALCIRSIFPGGTGESFAISVDMIRGQSKVFDMAYGKFGVAGIYLVKIVRVFFYGAFSAVPAFGFSVLIKNRYVVLSLPFIVTYFFTKFVEGRKSMVLYELLPKNISNIFMTDYLKMILGFGGTALAVLLFYRVCIGRKCDCGDE